MHQTPGLKLTVFREKTQSLRIIGFILVLFFLFTNIHIFFNIATGERGIFGSLLDDFLFVVLMVSYASRVFISMLVRSQLRTSCTNFFLFVILVLAFLQFVYYAVTIPSDDVGEILFKAGYSLRKVFLPLTLFFLFSHLINKEINKTSDYLLVRLIKLFTIFLWICIVYTISEATLRTISPEFNLLHMYRYAIYRMSEAGNPGYQMEDFSIAILNYLGVGSIKRPYGLQQEMYTSGNMIFLCYLFVFFMSSKFRIFSLLNGLVLTALFLAGSRTYLIPFFLLNGITLLIKIKKDIPILWPILTGLVLVFGIKFLNHLMLPAVASGDNAEEGYFEYLSRAIDAFQQNWKLFIFGVGPVGFSPWGNKIAWDGDFLYEVHHAVSGFGFLSIPIEIGLFSLILFILFHTIIFLSSRSKDTNYHSQYSKKLKIVIILNMVIGLSHWPTLFSTEIFVFHVFLLALLYNWSWFSRTFPKTCDKCRPMDGVECQIPVPA